MIIKFILMLVCMVSLSVLNARPDGSGYLSFNEDSIYYEWAGTGQALILIHDGLLHREVWDNQFSFFARDYKVVRYDRRGYGASSAATAPYTHLEDLKALFDTLRLEHAILIACSSGGALAIDFTLEYPEMVDGLVLVGAIVGGFSYTSHMHTRGGNLQDSFDDDMEENLYYVMEDPYEIYVSNQEAKERALQMLAAYPARINRRQNFALPEVPAYRRLNEIRISALILVGEYDIPDVHAHSGAINAGIPNSRRLIVPDAGHLIPLERPDAFNRLVSAYLKNI